MQLQSSEAQNRDIFLFYVDFEFLFRTMEPVALNRAALFTAAKAYRRTGNMYNRFGTTQEMMIQTVQENGTEAVLAIDSRGLYLTTAQFVGRPIADRNRYSGVRKEMPQRLAALGLDVDALVAANQHRIQVETASTKKVNPLKASKRGSKG